MSYTIAHQTEIKTNLPDLATQKPQQRGLVASWFLVDGKLVCKWFPETKINQALATIKRD